MWLALVSLASIALGENRRLLFKDHGDVGRHETCRRVRVRSRPRRLRGERGRREYVAAVDAFHFVWKKFPAT
jgi:hypothetical protein